MSSIGPALDRFRARVESLTPEELAARRERFEADQREYEARRAERQREELAAESIARSGPGWLEFLQRCGVPDVIATRLPASLQLEPELVEWARSLPRDGALWSLTLLGAPGTGKSWRAARLLGLIGIERPALRPGLDVRFEDVGLWLERMRQRMGEGDHEVFNRAAQAKVLVLDDVGTERPTEWAKDRVSLLLRERYNAQRPTVLTTNAAKLGDLGEALDGRISSRLAEGLVLRVGGPDQRVRSAS